MHRMLRGRVECKVANEHCWCSASPQGMQDAADAAPLLNPQPSHRQPLLPVDE